MAQPTQDNSSLLESAGKEVKEQVVEEKGGSEGVAEAGQFDATAPTTLPVAEAGPHVAKVSSTASSTDDQSSIAPSRPSPVTLNSTSSTTSITPVAPHPKRFSAVNINKKFLEKNTGSASSSNASTASAAKAGGAAARPSIQSTSSHSRLVAAKLTANPAVSSSPGGWSRPSSVAPSPGTATGSPISTSPLPSVAVAHPTSSAPQLPHAGKVIQPQPRAQLVQSQSTPKESAPVKPVWGNIKPSTGVRPDIASSDFPTAAEVAHNTNSVMLKQAKADEARVTSETAAKQLRLEEADAFRGIHLDPNAHHWDDMEEDDDNFLDGVIEFGDGRQYKVESSESQQSRLSTEAPSDSTTNGPVAKEERFVDDFDRSWPKSGTSPASVSKDVGSTASASHSVTPTSVSPVVPHAAHSPQDSSRVLFNERSNRLEPYSQSHRPNNAPFGAKRSGFPDVPHSDYKGGAQNIQVLQKPTGTDVPRPRRFSNLSNGGGNYTGGAVNGYAGDRNREPHRREGPPPSPRLPRDLPPHVHDTRDQDRGRRAPNAMAPPPLPQGGRQLPPHLPQSPTAVTSPRLPSRDSRRMQPEPALVATSPASTHFPAQSPAISQKSLLSPAVPEKALPPLVVPDLEVVRKDVMHSAAERAKQRRIQEEAEREAQKERARKKAAELEEKMKAIEAEKEKERREKEDTAEAARILQEKEQAKEKEKEKEKEAIAIIESAVKRAETLPRPPEQKPPEPVPPRAAAKIAPVPGSSQAPTAQPFERKPPPQRTGAILSRPPPVSVAPSTSASETESWRSRMAPTPTPRHVQVRPSTTTNFVAAGPSAAEQVETIANSQDDLEVVDFSDLGTFAGVPEVDEPMQVESIDVAVTPAPSTKQSRPVASDFFDAPINLPGEVPESKKADFGAWRRRVSQEMNESPTVQIPESKTAPGPLPALKDQPQQLEPALSIDSSMVSTKEPLTHIDQSPGHHVVYVSPTNTQRTPRGPLFKEAAMSALNDTMSRIKGALLHAHDPSKEAVGSHIGLEPETTQIGHTQQGTSRMPTVNNRWVPPALRPRHSVDPGRTVGQDHDRDEPREVFLVTMSQPPPSPRPEQLPVKFPSVSKILGPIPRKQLLAFSRPPFHARLQDVMTFDPPVYDMNRRDWSLNDVLFRKQPPSGFKGKWKYRVWLPRSRGPRIGVTGIAAKSFVRPTIADGASTWRKASTLKPEPVEEAQTLDTVSRSPPPEAMPPLVTVASIPKPGDSSTIKTLEAGPAVRTVTRSQPKMPQGSAVAFVRDSRIDVVQEDPRPLVNFIVGSQLDEAKSTTSEGTVSKPLGNVASMKLDDDDVPIFASIKSESKSSDDMTDSILVTPPSHHSASWARSSINLPLKDSPARAPDPEHLKAVWSQPPNKAGLRPVNSLEGIADDLTALPFTIQDVKSEDGETPPPSLPNGPTRILPFEVSRAFQQVPTSSASNNQPSSRPNFSPPSTQAPVARPATTTTTTAASPPYQYPPISPANMRPPYMAYPSAMMSHPPGSIVYGHPMTSSPVQRRMQANAGHTPLYSQPMWMTMPGTPQGMRPVPSPYPAQIMTYPPGYPHMPQPLPNMMPGTPQGQNGGRGRGMPVMSPSMSHAHPQPVQPMYGGSPVVIHAVPVHQNHGYMAMPGGGRGQPQNGQMPPPAPVPQQSPQHTLHSQPSNGFNAGSTPPFARTSW